jgi:type VI secretion system secreted protein VgrG
LPYYPPGKETRADEEFIHACTFGQNIRPGNVAHTDFDFTKPKADLTAKAKLIEKHERADYEIFDYPGEYLQADDGEHYARVRVDELHSEFDRGELECNVREIAVGRTFNFTNAPRRDQEREYLIVALSTSCRTTPTNPRAMRAPPTTASSPCSRDGSSFVPPGSPPCPR